MGKDGTLEVKEKSHYWIWILSLGIVLGIIVTLVYTF